MKAYILFHSKKGTTNAFGREIGMYLREKGIETTVKSIDDYDAQTLAEADIVLLGCWTHGLFLIMQHAAKAWQEFAHSLPNMSDKKVGLFTTYKVRTGSMFKNMKKHLGQNAHHIDMEIKSRSNLLSETNRVLIDEWINNN